MKKTRAFVAAFLIICMTVVGFSAMVQAASGDRSEKANVSEDVLAFYDAEHMNYIDKMPMNLQLQYEEEIALADRYLESLYGNDAMLSTSDNFVLDQYCMGIKLGLFLDVDDPDIIEEIRKFTNAAAEIYIKDSEIERTTGLNYEATKESTASTSSHVKPHINASGYNADAAVEYAHKWTEEGKKLCNPDFHRESADCTNFASQVLFAGGIPQISGKRNETSAWFYKYSLLSRPSYTWGGAHNLYEHLLSYSSSVERVTETADLKVGDIISFDTDSSDNKFHIDHTAIVTAVNGYRWSDILLTYHSTDRVDYPASNLIDAGYAAYAWSIG